MSVQVTVTSRWSSARFGSPRVSLSAPEMPVGEEEAVGYRRPPTHSRWKRGVSGNPSGKRKLVSNSIFEVLNAQMNELVAYNDKGRRRKMTRLQAGATQFSLKVATGDPTYLKLYLEYASKGLLRPIPQAVTAEELDDEDKEIIALAEKRRAQ